MMETVYHRVRREVKELFVRSRPPDWDRVIFGYAKNYLAKNVWRVSRELDLDDLMQEAYLLFLKLEQRYGNVTDKHFVALWKVALHHWIWNLARAKHNRRECRLPTLRENADDHREIAIVDHRAERDLAQLEWEDQVRAAPARVQRLIAAIEGGSSSRPRMHRKRKHRETTNEYMCRLAGFTRPVRLRAIFDMWIRSDRK